MPIITYADQHCSFDPCKAVGKYQAPVGFLGYPMRIWLCEGHKNYLVNKALYAQMDDGSLTPLPGFHRPIKDDDE